MYRKEVNERSPMRVFENSMHGGLGRGNIGVVASGPGVGKTPLLVQIALDDLLRDRRVLHISHKHTVDHIRTFYSEVFHDLALMARLEEPDAVMLDVERHRLIFSLVSKSDEQPISARGGSDSPTKLSEVIAFARDLAHFIPDVLIVDGFDLVRGTRESLVSLKQIAKDLNAEVWISANTQPLLAGNQGIPAPLDQFADLVSAVVFLEPAEDRVQLKLLKDHENTNLTDLRLRLDTPTMRIVDEDVRPVSEIPRDPRRFRMISGGSRGAEAEFGVCAERWGMSEVNYSFEGHRVLERHRGVVVLSETELNQGDFSLSYASKRLNRALTKIPLVRNVLKTIWHQITNASQVFAVGVIQEDSTVRGGTGWGVELSRLWKKPLFVFDQEKRAWFRWSGTAWEITGAPVITAQAFAGIGTQSLSDDGRRAIAELFVRSFGDPS
jgi:hypothetical protein